VLSFQPSTVNDEASEAVMFAADHSPQHAHVGPPVDLTAVGSCPLLTKFSYLLQSTSPEYVTESPGRNPIRYQLITDDPGVGITAGSTQYRVGRRIGTSTSWILDWTPAGTGFPIGASVTRFPVSISSDVVTGLATTEGVYDIEFRASDRLGRTTTVARCFDLRLRAPPLEFEPESGPRPTKNHTYALDSLSLAQDAPYDQIAARLLNNNATGASLIDQDVWNGTTETIFLTVTVTKPIAVMVAQSFVVHNAITNVTGCPGGACPLPSMLPQPYDSLMPAGSVVETTLHFPAKVFEVMNGVPAGEIPCIAPCPPEGSVFTFAIPPRATGGQPARVFRVMTMIGQVSALWPSDSTSPASAPFADEELTWSNPNGTMPTTTRFTGIVDRTVVPERTGCVLGMAPSCQRQGTKVPFRALRFATLTFASATESQYATAATAGLAPVIAAPVKLRPSLPTNNWTTSEGVLPPLN
jgi:hypothetical protein